jgi:predicted DNA-binding transcriptional regulator AlpA
LTRPHSSPEGPYAVSVEPIYLKAEDVAALLQISRASVFRMARRDRTMPCLAIAGIVRFPRERLLLWLRQREQGAVARPRASKTAPEARNGHQDGHTSGSDESAQIGGAK